MAGSEDCSAMKLVCFALFMCIVRVDSLSISQPVISSASVLNASLVHDPGDFPQEKLLVQVLGRNLHGQMRVRPTLGLTAPGTQCAHLSNENAVDSGGSAPLWTNGSSALFTIVVPHNLFSSMNQWSKIYLCVLSDSYGLQKSTFSQKWNWIHQGAHVVLDIRTRSQVPQSATSSVKSKEKDERFNPAESRAWSRRRRAAQDWGLDGHGSPSTSPGAGAVAGGPSVFGFRVESASHAVHTMDDAVPAVLAGSEVTLRLFGAGLTNGTDLGITAQDGDFGEPCHFLTSGELHSLYAVTAHSALVNVRVPTMGGMSLYLCLRDRSLEPGDAPKPSPAQWVHQGSELFLQLRSYEKMLPLWVSIVIILLCLMFSALFSGLNLGLMSLDRTDLKIICNTGTDKERRYAKVILPVRNHGNFLLCSILLGNVLVNSTLTILMDDLTSGLVAVICSTLAIVVFGEITPQAFCSRHGLAVGAKTIHITKVVMGVTSPLSYPISKILDVLLGEEIGNVYTRERIKELVKVTTEFNDLEKDEVNIIAGALELRKKTVADVMTKLEDVYMLPYDSILDFETVSEIMKSGFSRVPVYEGDRTNIVTMLYIKDLAFVDPDDETPLKTLCQFYQNECNFVFEDTTLDVMFKQFKEGIKGHMALVHCVNNEGEGDPFYETVGLITLEDVIEELIQAEIMDETDVFTDNRSKKRRNQNNAKQDFTVFCERRENQRIQISPQLTLATFQYLSASVDAFKPHNISETILRRLLKHDVIYHIKIKNKEKARQDPSCIIYQQGKPADYFVLILEGRVEVTVGRENLMFESGPFTYFGTQALMQNVNVADSPTAPQNLGSLQSVNLDLMLRHTFVPDYTVRAVMDVLYVRVKRSAYLAAKQATLMAQSRKDSTDEHFDDEVEKLLHSMDEDEARCRAEVESPSMNQPLQRPYDRLAARGSIQAQNMVVPPPSNTENSPNGSIHMPLSPARIETSAVTNTTPKDTPPGSGKKVVLDENEDELKSLLPPNQEAC